MSRTRTGLAYAIAAFLWWGLSPIYWKLLDHVSASELLAHRVVWLCALLAVLLAARGRLAELVAAVRSRRVMLTLLVTTGLIAVNWFTFIWAVNSERTLEASLGYFINPLVSVLLGLVVLRERLSRAQGLALGLAAAGVALLTARVGQVPWAALTLAFSFGFYGLLRKTVDAGPTVGLLVETLLLSPLALVYLIRLQASGGGAFGTISPATDGLIAVSGVVTALPLLWFTHGARRLPLSTIGFLQYLAPTVQFLLAVFAFREPFTPAHLAAFGLIWAALAVFSVDARERYRASRRVPEPASGEPPPGRVLK